MPLTNEEGVPLNEEEKIERLLFDLKKAYKKNQSLAKANKSLRLQLHQATKKTLSQKTKHEIVREVMSVSVISIMFVGKQAKHELYHSRPKIHQSSERRERVDNFGSRVV